MKHSLVLAVVMVLATGCSSSDQPTRSYTVRGVVKGLKTTKPAEMQILHESIPSFADQRGTQVGMPSMEMPFGVVDGVALTDIEAGDKVELTFEARWGSQPTGQITAIAELPADTQLTLTGM